MNVTHLVATQADVFSQQQKDDRNTWKLMLDVETGSWHVCVCLLEEDLHFKLQI